MDFYRIRERRKSNGVVEIYPEFLVARSRDIMVQAKTFVGIWDDENGLWSTDEYDVARLVDSALDRYFEENKPRYENNARVLYMRDFSSGIWVTYRSWVNKLSDNARPLDQKLIFADSPVRKADYASKRLPYSLDDEFPKAWDKLIGKLYSKSEREKIEWSIGAVVSGDSKKLQKFLVLYGEKGTGKSTVLDIVQKLFKGYYTVFEAKALGQSSNQFATESFKSSPLVAIQHDGDLSRIEDNTRLNSIISHEEMVINEKNKPLYNTAISAFLFMGTNHPVKITDAKSGIIRRLIDATPTGERFDIHEYEDLVSQVDMTLGSVANHCLKVYRHLGKNYYRDYIPMAMMQKTDVFYNFIDHISLDLENNDPITLKRAWDLYRNYVDETRLEYTMPQYKFREALKDYYESFEQRAYIGGERQRNVYSGFKRSKLESPGLQANPESPYSLVLDQEESLIDDILKKCPAQYSNANGTPSKKWDDVTTTLSDIDTTLEHYVRIADPHHIVIDFDIRDEDGEKSSIKNIEAASSWPPTYGEFSKSGKGVHLHYIYDGDPSELSSVYSPGIEVKVFGGKSSLRRRLSFCNSVPVAHISDGLPKKERKMLNRNNVKDEAHIRRLVESCLRKEHHGATKPEVDFIKHILDEAYEGGVKYDISDMKPRIMTFALGSTNQANACLRVFSEMKFSGQGMEPAEVVLNDSGSNRNEEELVFFDIEVYPNFFLVCYNRMGTDSVTAMVDPSPEDIESLFEFPLVGFNNRQYDNHILYARYMGASNEELYEISKRIIRGDRDAKFGNAYNISYTDVYDFANTKQSLKAWEIDLGIEHIEMDIPWDEPVPDNRREDVIRYCKNDVLATKKVFEHLKEDWEIRKALAAVVGFSPNATTNDITQQITFGDDRNPAFVWTDLSETFPGYRYSYGKSEYRGEIVGEGGYVYAEPGIYENVALLDVASMHPTSIIKLRCFGDHTDRFEELVKARLAIKRHDIEAAGKLLDGKLKDAIKSEEAMDIMAKGLKIPINSSYGLTAASFPNRANGKNPANNPDNIVAKRGALFMVDLKHMVQEAGFTVAHIKTDSIKIPNATPDIINKVMEFGKKYGYTFEHEATYEKMCLVNNAVYIAKENGVWKATGKQFAEPVVYKTLFSNEAVVISDYFEKKSVKTSLSLGWVRDGASYPEFVGRVGSFVPVKQDGAPLLRKIDPPTDISKFVPRYVFRDGDGELLGASSKRDGTGLDIVYDKSTGIDPKTVLKGDDILKVADSRDSEFLFDKTRFAHATGTKGHLWNLSSRVGSIDNVDTSYHDKLVDEARDAISVYGDIEAFLS